MYGNLYNIGYIYAIISLDISYFITFLNEKQKISLCNFPDINNNFNIIVSAVYANFGLCPKH